MSNKKEDAISIIKKCIGQKGIWASTGRYHDQCWTRDFCIATSYLFMHNTELYNPLLNLNHLINLSQKQSSNGKIPILFPDNKKNFLSDKVQKSIETGNISFMLARYIEEGGSKGLYNLTPHTRDSEVLFIITTCQTILCLSKTEYWKNIHIRHQCSNLYESACLALYYLKENILKDGLIAGADWRDVRMDLDDKNVLTNACLLYEAYKQLLNVIDMHKNKNYDMPIDHVPHNISEDMAKTKKLIQEKYWNGTYFVDYPGSDKFDLLGNSLVVLFDIANEIEKESIFNYAMSLSGPAGIKTTETFLPALTPKEKEVMDRDGAVIWPFTNGFMLDAMITKGGPKWIEFAKKEFTKWDKLDGFYEWYDIVDCNGYGSINQVWSAALYLRVSDNIKNYSNKSNEHLL